ncbi:TRAP transporter small permease [Sinirhodobacter populi]|uniref:TRAP transporter small permease protein n=1 Tax=Paenirhodobacter populi TaxID=2306993 RepID=A0A443K585_9RHOB|nr:TRAP transporter small permease [Sinirhodobacter populi]RWR27939.1 TRAP transporter small permease [Sinirhodobacter populi]
MKQRFARWADALDQLVRTVGAMGVAILAALVSWTVFSRYFLGQTPRWSEELPRLILVWTTFLGVASAFGRGTHFEGGMLALITSSPQVLRVCAILATLASVAFLLVLFVTGARISQFTWHHETTAMSLPGGLFYLCLPVGAGLSLLALILRGLSR